jgi:hypothetical protein
MLIQDNILPVGPRHNCRTSESFVAVTFEAYFAGRSILRMLGSRTPREHPQGPISKVREGLMPTYYFDMKDGAPIRDRVGLEIPTDLHAIEHSKKIPDHFGHETSRQRPQSRHHGTTRVRHGNSPGCPWLPMLRATGSPISLPKATSCQPSHINPPSRRKVICISSSRSRSGQRAASRAPALLTLLTRVAWWVLASFRRIGPDILSYDSFKLRKVFTHRLSR